MLENQYVSAAAKAVISVVDEDRRGMRPGYEQGGFYTLEGAVANEIYKHLDMPFEHALGQAVEQARQEEIGIRLGHLDPRDLADYDPEKPETPENLPQTKAEKLRTLLAQAMDELEELTDHQCQFGEDDYCLTCGCDGRA